MLFRSQHPESWDDVILQGPHLGVSTPMVKQPNPSMSSNKDWSEVDLEAMPEDFIPATAYQPNRAVKHDYDTAYGHWQTTSGPVPVASQFRVAWRRMAATTGFRTLYPAIIPPGAHHVHPVNSAGHPDETLALVKFGAVCSSLLIDFRVRSGGTSEIQASQVAMLPMPVDAPATNLLSRLYLRLNCLTSVYAPLWEEITGEEWTAHTPFRNALERQQAQNKIDVLVALSLGVTAEELCMIYRTQFPVMRRYDRENLFDSRGRLVPKQIARSETASKVPETLSESERTWTHPQSGVEYLFEYPFRILDREEDFKKEFDRYSSPDFLSA